MNYKAVFISDVHLGTRFSRADLLLKFFKQNSYDELYLVGDIVDFWALKRKIIWPQAHSDVIQKILKSARKGKKVHLITGNHDEFLRQFIPFALGNNVEVYNKKTFTTQDGKRFLVVHGDFFDAMTVTKKWVTLFGDVGYDLLLLFNGIIEKIRHLLGIKRYWSLAKYVKENIKSSRAFINNYEEVLAQHAKRKKFDGVICGHIHKASKRTINDTLYLNCGDWLESCTAVALTHEDEFVLIDWLHECDHNH